MQLSLNWPYADVVLQYFEVLNELKFSLVNDRSTGFRRVPKVT